MTEPERGGTVAFPTAGPRSRWRAPDVLRWLAGAAPLDPVPSSSSDWRRLAERCAELRVLPQMFVRLNESPGRIPRVDVAEFSRRRLESLIRTTHGLMAGCRALRELGSAGIPAAGFKGLAAVGWLHDGQPRRGVGDADVVVPPERAPEAIERLVAAGFRPKVAGVSQDDVVRFSRHSPGSAGNESLSLAAGAGMEVDLHWKLGAFDVGAMIEDARMIRVLGEEVPLVRPGMGLLLAVHHSLRNDFVPDECIRDLLDATGWLRLLAADPAESAWTDGEARRIGLSVARDAFVGILAANGIDPLRPVPPAGSPAALLAELFGEQAETGPLNTDLVYLCSVVPAWTLFKGLMTGGAGYLRAMRAMEQANGEVRPGLGGRLQRLLGDAWTVPLARWRHLRVLARCKNRVR